MDFWAKPELDARYAQHGHVLNMRGNLAVILIEKWGTVAGHIREKEDSGGRAVLDVMPASDVVDRAFEIADLTVAELERREWIRAVDVTPEELGEQCGVVDKAREAKRYDLLRERVASRAGNEAPEGSTAT